MKIIIVYASAGAGHFKAAQALHNCFKNKYPSIDVKMVDLLDKADGLFKYTYISFYTFMVRHAFFLWGWLFSISEKGPLKAIIRKLSTASHYLNTRPFARYLAQEDPDVIISTHFAPPEIAAHLLRQGKIHARLVTVVTDFGVHPFWVSENTDLYIAASEFTRQQMLKMGVEDKRIRVCGIPVDPKFSRSHDRDNLCRSLGIDKDIFTVLVMTGSFGIGPIEGIVKALCKEAQVLVVTASNAQLRDKLIQADLPGAKIYGFVNNADELMAVSDVIITKPGGLSTSEILVMELAPIFISAIPGQERWNVEAMISAGVGSEIDNIEGIRKKVAEYRDNPDELLAVKERIRKIRKPESAEEICDAVCQSCGGA